MQLTLHTDYSFRVLIYLYLNDSEPATVGQISDYFGVSRNHLVKVVNNLAHLGFVETVRGKGGGVTLMDAARELSAGDILRQLEESRPLVDCIGRAKHQRCAVLPVCRLNSVLDGAIKLFFEELDRYKLEDLVKR